ncbi:hypothetical protein DQ04_00231180 [Trypanosoma grayi]|uniref:hypothetical protein n=1 Tax=Trypanosoma grayi TaxID=71804 RepID=UPI0004F41444|nr:hypothetical protein DQ04_00231180 [Trypanosoma grayi]KEG14992.1 hypothetical protein DQ04_00231180 [Trypanosoma grayi]
MHRAVAYVSCAPVSRDVLRDSEVTSAHSSGSDCSPTSSSNKMHIPLRRHSHLDGIDEVFGNDRFSEIRRQKELLLRAYLTRLEELVDVAHMSLESNSLHDASEYVFSFSRQHSPWRCHQPPSNVSNVRPYSHIHESSQGKWSTPCRNDHVYASEKHRTVSRNSFVYHPGAAVLQIKLSPSGTRVACLLAWDETGDRHMLLVLEERQRQRFHANEVSAYLSLQRSIRRSAHFHLTRFSSLEAIRYKEVQYLERNIANRAERHDEEHRAFMRSLPPVRLPPLRIPSVTADGRPYRSTAVDYEVALSVAVEKKIWDVAGDRKKSFFPELV